MTIKLEASRRQRPPVGATAGRSNAALPQIGADSFHEMIGLALLKRLVVCRFAVEGFYFQTAETSAYFLNACVLSDLLVELDLRELPPEYLNREHLAQLSAHGETLPTVFFPKGPLDEHDEKRTADHIKRKVDLVLTLCRLYNGSLKGSTKLIEMSYQIAVEAGQLRHADLARRRRVSLTPLAKLYLMHDFFEQEQVSATRLPGDASQAHRRERRIKLRPIAESRTLDWVLKSGEQSVTLPKRSTGHSTCRKELETFVLSFLTGNTSPHVVAMCETLGPTNWVPFVYTLACDLYRAELSKGSASAKELAERFRLALEGRATAINTSRDKPTILAVREALGLWKAFTA